MPARPSIPPGPFVQKELVLVPFPLPPAEIGITFCLHRLWSKPNRWILLLVQASSHFQLFLSACCLLYLLQFSSVQSLSRVRLFVTPWIAARQASLSITNSQSLSPYFPIYWQPVFLFLCFLFLLGCWCSHCAGFARRCLGCDGQGSLGLILLRPAMQ